MQRRTSTLLALVAILALAVATDRLRATAHRERQAAQTYDDLYYLPPPGWLRVFSLGWNEALADLVWMRALVYFGDEYHHAGSVRHVFEYSEAIATLDPQFLAIYRWVGMAGLYRPQGATPEDIERAVTFMERGARLFPNDGDLAWDIGAALVFELVPLLPEEERDEVRARGMPYLMTASRLGAAPEWAVLTNASLLSRIGLTDQAARHLEEIYPSVDDPVLRRQIADRITDLRQRAQAEALMAALEELEADRNHDFPYLDLGLYVLVGKRPPIDVDRATRLGIPRALSGGGD